MALTTKLQRLLEIAEALERRDIADLAARQADRRLAQNARTDFASRSKAERDLAAEDLTYQKDHEFSRRVWRDRQAYALVHHEARAAALVEAQRPIAAKSVGRSHVLRQLLANAKKQSRR